MISKEWPRENHGASFWLIVLCFEHKKKKSIHDVFLLWPSSILSCFLKSPYN